MDLGVLLTGRDQPAEVPVNAGAYQSHYVLAGMRFARRF